MNTTCPDTSRFLARMYAAAACSPLYAAPPRRARPLRLLLVAPDRVPAWLWTFLCLAADTMWLNVTVLPVVGARLPDVPDVPLGVRMFLGLEGLYRRRASTTLSPVTVHARGGVGLASPIAPDASPQHLKSRIRELRPDLVLSLAPHSWSAILSDAAKYGCWEIDAGLVDPARAGVSLMLPVIRNESTTELTLELEGAPLAPWGHARSVGATRRGAFAFQRDGAFRKLPLLLLRMLHRLAADDFVPPRRVARLRIASPAMPRSADAMHALFATLGATLRWQVEKSRPDVPSLLVVRDAHAPLDPSTPRVGDALILQAPGNTRWGDPCAVEAQGRRFIFVEESGGRNTGEIACLEVHGSTASRVGVALEEESRVGYPQVFEWQGHWYMTVESSALKRVSLYRATRFPLGWERVADLIRDRVCADPTLYFHDGRWYLFATVSENRNGTCDELFLFVSDELCGPFEPHPANPIVSDVRRARPAGRLFRHGGRLIRPAQDCASHYGSAVVFNEVLVLSPTHYEERPLSRLAFGSEHGPFACHTYSRTPTFEVLDAYGHATNALPRIEVLPPSHTMPVDANQPVDIDLPAGFPPAADNGRLYGLSPGSD